MVRIPRDDWVLVREQVSKVQDQVEELAVLFQQRRLRVEMKKILESTQQHFLKNALSLKDVVQRNRDLSEVLHHDLFGYFSLISLLIQRMQMHFDEAESLLLAMNLRVQVMSHVVEALRFHIEDEVLPVKEVALVPWLRRFESFFRDTFKSYDSQRRQTVPLVEFQFPSEGDVSQVMTKANPSLVLLLLINVVQNAREHGKARKVMVVARSFADEVVLEVVDDGQGVPDEVQKSLFHKRITTRNSCGLGLAYARERMAVMGGKIDCDPHGGIDGGAKFLLVFQKVC